MTDVPTCVQSIEKELMSTSGTILIVTASIVNMFYALKSLRDTVKI